MREEQKGKDRGRNNKIIKGERERERESEKGRERERE